MQNLPTVSAPCCIRQGTDFPRWSGHTFQPVHSNKLQDLSKLKAPDCNHYKYWSYFCVADGPGNERADHFSIRFACTNDLSGQWEFFGDQEIVRGRWPTVYCDGKYLYMFYGDTPDEFRLKLATSTDGVHWRDEGGPILPHSGDTGANNPFLWIDDAFYLFYHDECQYGGVGPKYYRIIYRKVALTDTLDKMRQANGVVVLEDANLVAAPSVYRDNDGKIVLLVETYENSVWETAAYSVPTLEESAEKGRVKDPPVYLKKILGKGDACAMPFYDGEKLYVFYAHQAKPDLDLWNIMMTTL